MSCGIVLKRYFHFCQSPWESLDIHRSYQSVNSFAFFFSPYMMFFLHGVSNTAPVADLKQSSVKQMVRFVQSAYGCFQSPLVDQ